MFKTTDNDTLKQDKSVNHVGTSFCQPCLEVQQIVDKNKTAGSSIDLEIHISIYRSDIAAADAKIILLG